MNENLKKAINNAIKANGSGEITGPVLNGVMIAMIDSITNGAVWKGMANKTMAPGTPDNSVFYIANEGGVYPNFGRVNLKQGLSIIYNTKDTAGGTVWNAVDVLSTENLTTEGYQYVGVAKPSDTPTIKVTKSKLFWIASEVGTYTNFSGLVVAEGEQCALKWDGSAWSKEVIGRMGVEIVQTLGNNSKKVISQKVVTEELIGRIRKKVGKNLFDYKTTIKGVYTNSGGELSSNSNYESSDYIKVEQNKDYAISFGGARPDGASVQFFDGDFNFLSSIKQSKEELVITTPKNTHYLRISNTKLFIELTSIELGNTVTQFETYTELYDSIDTSDIKNNSITEEKLNDTYKDSLNNTLSKKVDINSKNIWNENIEWTSYLNSQGNPASGLENYGLQDYIEIKAETEYALSNRDSAPIANRADFSIVFYNELKEKISWIPSNTITFTTPKNAKYLRASVVKANSIDIQLEMGNERTAYAEYGGVSGYIDDYMKTYNPLQHIPDNSIQPQKTTFFNGGKNLLNPNMVTVGGYISPSNGTVLSNPNYSYTDYIEIDSNQENIYGNLIGTSGAGNAFYDENKSLISTWKGATTSIPQDAKYARFTIHSKDLEYIKNNVQIEYGSVETTFEPFKLIIPSKYIPKQEIDIPDHTITPSKTTFFVLGKNILNPDDVVIGGGYINMSGGVNQSTSHSHTNYILIDASKVYITCNLTGSEVAGTSNAFYDENKKFISYWKGHSAQIPSNAKYVRFTIVSTSYDVIKNTAQIEYGNESTLFEPYGATFIDPKYIKDKPNNILNEIVLASKTYMLDGVKNDIFHDTYTKIWNPYKWNIDVNGLSNWIRRFERVFSTKNPSNSTATFRLYDIEQGIYIESKTTKIVVGNPNIGTSEVKVSIIGDSYTNGDFYVQALLDKGYVPNLKLIGLRRTNSTYTTQHDEGRGGWTLARFFNVKPYSLNDFAPFMQPNGEFKFWGSKQFWVNAWKCVRGTAGSEFEPNYSASMYDDYVGLFDETSGYKLNPTTNDIMYDWDIESFVKYNGSNWVAVNQEDYTWSFDYSKYIAMYSLEVPDMLVVYLGVNDFWINRPNEESILVWNNQMNDVYNSYRVANPNGKLVIMTPNTVTMRNSNRYNSATVHRNMWLARKNIIDTYDNREGEGIYVLDASLGIDSENSFTIDTNEDIIKPFDEYSGNTTFKGTSDGQHPRISYLSLGYCLAAFIQANRV